MPDPAILYPHKTPSIRVPTRISNQEAEPTPLPGGTLTITQSHTREPGNLEFSSDKMVYAYERTLSFVEDDGTEGENGFELTVSRETLPGIGPVTGDRFRTDSYGARYRLVLRGESAGRVLPEATGIAITFTAISKKPVGRTRGCFQTVQADQIGVIVRGPDGGLIEWESRSEALFVYAANQIQMVYTALGNGVDPEISQVGGETHESYCNDIVCMSVGMMGMDKLLLTQRFPFRPVV